MGFIVKSAKRIDMVFLCLVTGVLIINYPYFRHVFCLRHDTLFNLQIFYFFYNEYFFHHQLAQWMPYGVYGFPAALFQLGIISPAEYFTGFLGALLGVKNVLLLFNLSVVFEQLIFLSGMYFLSKLLFKRKLVVFFVCMASFCSMAWLYQIIYNLRLYEFFPFELYFLILFIERRRSCYFWMVCIIGVFWSMGAWFYLSFLWLFLGTVIGLALIILHPGSWKAIWPKGKIDAFVMVIFFILASVYLAFFVGSFQGIACLHRGQGGANAINTFLTYGHNADFSSVVSWFFMGKPIYTPLGAMRDNTVYAGFATAFFFIWSMAYVRNKYFLAILAGFGMLVLLSFGHRVAWLAYFFPGMKFYRHVGLVYPLVKVCVCLGAGYGLLDFLQCPGKLRKERLLSVLGICLLLMELTPMQQQGNGGFLDLLYLLAIFFYCLAFLSIALSPNEGLVLTKGLQWFAVFIFLAMALEVLVFQGSMYQMISPALSDDQLKDLKSMEVHQLSFIPQRGLPPTGRQEQALRLERNIKVEHSAEYESQYAFAQYEPCQVMYLDGLLTDNVNGFLNISFTKWDAVLKVTGCSSPKIRILDKSKFFGNTKEMAGYMLSTPKMDDTALLMRPSVGVPLPEAGDNAGSLGSDSYAVGRFTTDGLLLKTDIKKRHGAWLIYADAFYPGWKAYLDGASTRIYQAYISFKAVFVPAGEHQIRLVFFNGLTSVLSYVMAFFGLLAGALAFLVLLAATFGADFN